MTHEKKFRRRIMVLLISLGLLALGQTALPAAVRAEKKSDLPAMDVRQRLGERLPLELTFTDDNGRTIALKEIFSDKPVLLTFVYFNCPMLCPLNMKALGQSLRIIEERPGKDYELLVVSIDPKDTSSQAQGRKKQLADLLNKPGSENGIHFLTGEESLIRALAQASGFAYEKTENQQYAHSTVLMVLTPDGKISRYLFGLEYPPRDIKLALADSRQKKMGTFTDQILMYCFAYNPHMGRYSLAVFNLLRLAAGITVFLVGLLIYLLRRQERAYAP